MVLLFFFLIFFKCVLFLHVIPFQCPLAATATLKTPPVCPQTVQMSPTHSVSDAAVSPAGSESLSLKRVPSSQGSNSLSLLTEMSGVEAPVPLRSVSVLQSLASGLPGWRGEVGNKWG